MSRRKSERITVPLLNFTARISSDASAKAIRVMAALMLVGTVGLHVGAACGATELNTLGEKSKQKLKELNTAIQSDPKSPAALVARGDFFAAAEMHESAYADYDRAIALSPKFGLAYLQRGHLSYEAGAIEKSVPDLLMAGKLMTGPKKGEALRFAGRAQIKLSQWQAALNTLNQAVAAEGPEGRHLSVRERARCHYELHQYKDALEDATRVIAVPLRHDDEIYALRAQTYMKLGNYNAAVKDLTKAMEESSLKRSSAKSFIFSSSNTGYYKLRAECYKKLGQRKLELADLDKAKVTERDAIDFAPFR